jgi:lysylphosphatidylglycerol synthetase-like protein (DUF2156 family)
LKKTTQTRKRNPFIWLLIIFALLTVFLTIWDIRITVKQQAMLPNSSFLLSIFSYSAFTCALFFLLYLFTRGSGRRKMHRVVLYGAWVLIIYNAIDLFFFREMEPDGLSNMFGVLLAVVITMILMRYLPFSPDQEKEQKQKQEKGQEQAV